jgi:hypothetical protein
MIEGLLLQQRLDAVREALRAVRRRRAVVLPLVIGALVAGGLALAGGRPLGIFGAARPERAARVLLVGMGKQPQDIQEKAGMEPHHRFLVYQ